VPFERRDIDLTNKPDWFDKLSPLGKVPILVVDDQSVLFESSVIAQYVDEISGRKLLATDPLRKYGQLAWMEFASQLIADIGRLYSANNQSAVDDGPWFAGSRFSLVDAAFAPAFRYFDSIEALTGDDYFGQTPKLAQWRDALSKRRSVVDAVSADYPQRLRSFLALRDSFIGHLASTETRSQRDAA